MEKSISRDLYEMLYEMLDKRREYGIYCRFLKSGSLEKGSRLHKE